MDDSIAHVALQAESEFNTDSDRFKLTDLQQRSLDENEYAKLDGVWGLKITPPPISSHVYTPDAQQEEDDFVDDIGDRDDNRDDIGQQSRRVYFADHLENDDPPVLFQPTSKLPGQSILKK